MFWKTIAGAVLVSVIVIAIISMHSCTSVKPEAPNKPILPEVAQKPEPESEARPEPEPAQAKKPEPEPKPAPKPEPEPDPKSILLDPNDMSQKLSYWRDAKEGDWVRFLNWRKNLIIYKVLKRDGDVVKLGVKEYTRAGKEIPEEEPDIRQVDIKQDDEIMRNSATQNPFVERSVFKWKLYESNKVLHCERHYVPNPMTEEHNEVLWSRDIRCGGFVFMRRGDNSYVIMVDYGDKEHQPKWDHLKPADLLKYWQNNDRFTFEKLTPQKDPPGGEPPEKPEK